MLSPSKLKILERRNAILQNIFLLFSYRGRSLNQTWYHFICVYNKHRKRLGTKMAPRRPEGRSRNFSRNNSNLSNGQEYNGTIGKSMFLIQFILLGYLLGVSRYREKRIAIYCDIFSLYCDILWNVVFIIFS